MDSMGSERKAKCCVAIMDAMKFLVCPISNKIPADPVIGNDGFIYERELLEKYIDDLDRGKGIVPSPATYSDMCVAVTECPSLWCAIENLMTSGSFPLGDSR